MIVKLNRRIDTEQTVVDNSLTAMRRDFETEVTKIKSLLVNLGAAVKILTEEYSQNPNDSKLNPEKHKHIEELLNA